MTDFNVAALLPTDKDHKLHSFAGTVSYMAPEVLKRSGYREEADWWSMAVVVFELLFGKRPFRANSGKEVMYKIVHSQYRFPSYSVREISEDCIDFITRCLERGHSQRLGVQGVDDLKSHPWFKDVDWRLCENKGLTPPFQPNLKSGNYSAIHEAEDILLEDKPLKPNRRKSVFIPNDPDLLSIQESFSDYDFTWSIPEEEKRKRLERVYEHSQRIENENADKDANLDGDLEHKSTTDSDEEEIDSEEEQVEIQ